MIKTNSMQLKEINTHIVRSLLRTKDSFTKNSLANNSGLSVATCGNILKELLASGEVLELNQKPSTGGRPSRVFKYNSDFMYTAVLFPRKEGSTNTLVCAVYNMLEECVYHKISEHNEITLSTLESAIKDLLSLYQKIQSIGIGVPGVVTHGNITICDFESLCDIPLKSHIEKEFSVKTIVENDVNCSALGYYNKLSKQENYHNNLVYIYHPLKGFPGAGIIINGKILKGFSNYSGEIANLPFGLSPEEYLLIQDDEHKFVDIVAKSIASFNCIVNTQKIVLSGFQFSKSFMSKLETAISDLIPEPHIPEILFEEDFSPSYLSGLNCMASKLLSCQIEVSKLKQYS